MSDGFVCRKCKTLRGHTTNKKIALGCFLPHPMCSVSRLQPLPRPPFFLSYRIQGKPRNILQSIGSQAAGQWSTQEKIKMMKAVSIPRNLIQTGRTACGAGVKKDLRYSPETPGTPRWPYHHRHAFIFQKPVSLKVPQSFIAQIKARLNPIPTLYIKSWVGRTGLGLGTLSFTEQNEKQASTQPQLAPCTLSRWLSEPWIPLPGS